MTVSVARIGLHRAECLPVNFENEVSAAFYSNEISALPPPFARKHAIAQKIRRVQKALRGAIEVVKLYDSRPVLARG